MKGSDDSCRYMVGYGTCTNPPANPPVPEHASGLPTSASQMSTTSMIVIACTFLFILGLVCVACCKIRHDCTSGRIIVNDDLGETVQERRRRRLETYQADEAAFLHELAVRSAAMPQVQQPQSEVTFLHPEPHDLQSTPRDSPTSSRQLDTPTPTSAPLSESLSPAHGSQRSTYGVCTRSSVRVSRSFETCPKRPSKKSKASKATLSTRSEPRIAETNL